MNTPNDAGDDTINALVEGDPAEPFNKRHEKCTYQTCQWPNCICEAVSLHEDREAGKLAECRREIEKARKALDELEAYLRETL